VSNLHAAQNDRRRDVLRKQKAQIGMKNPHKGCAPQGRAARKAALFRDNGIKNPPKASALRGFCALFSRKNSSLCGCEAVFEEQNCLIRQSRKPQETCRFSRIPAQHLGSFAFKNRRFLAQHTPRAPFH
jgi:hypothetical protein